MDRINILSAIPALCACMATAPLSGQDGATHFPELHGTIRAKHEYEPSVGKSRFEIRNARLSAEGNVAPIVGYKAEIDLSDEGNIRMLDTYVRIQPTNTLRLTFGQMRVPFTIDAHRSPHQQFFANRSFGAKQVGDVRDVGASAAWTFNGAVPIILEGGIFNGSGLTNQKNFWTNSHNFSFKAQAMPARQFNITLSCQKAHAGDTDVMIYDAGAYWEHSGWHIEGEYLRKSYARGAFSPVTSVNAFAVYRLPLKKKLASVSFLGRYDYMSNHSKGTRDENGTLKPDDPERHRFTEGVTLSLGGKALQSDIRINYEQYVYAPDVTPAISEQNKIVVELVAHF